MKPVLKLYKKRFALHGILDPHTGFITVADERKKIKF